ncbi:MAG: ammonium transporter [Armatimonadetes bacterium]|nr:ammonium transporter [Armatimonadota bacterium]
MRGFLYRFRTLGMTAGATVACLLLGAGAALAESSAKIDTGDTAWVLASSALVLVMTPGLGLFYAGMVRRKNALGTILQSFVMCGIVGVLWVVYGYSLSFGTDHGGLIGSLEWLGLRGVGMAPAKAPFDALYGATIPQEAHMIFQAMFAIITPALITGAFAERMRFKAFFIFMILWSTIVYCPVAHWVWGLGGWLGKLGAIDFAGGTVVHICSGVAALCCAIVLGRRKGYGREEFMPHNLTMTLIGTGLLWFGWFGFNGGSALASNGLATNAFVVTNTAAAAAMVSWLLVEWMHRGKPTALGAASGAVAGLVAITPASGYVGPMAAIAIGGVVSMICYGAIMLKGKLGYDDSLDVFGVHGVGGTWGAIATSLFASKIINPAGADGLFHGNPALLGKQLIAIISVAAYSFVVTFILLKVISLFTPLRLDKEEEETGLDLTQHGEVGYSLQ